MPTFNCGMITVKAARKINFMMGDKSHKFPQESYQYSMQAEAKIVSTKLFLM